MPRRRTPIERSSIAEDILTVLETFAKDSQFYPTQRALYTHMRRQGYSLTLGCFNYWFSRLVQAGRIEVDWQNTRAIRAVSLMIVDSDFSNF